MVEPVIVEMMSQGVPLWRCLHDGPFTRESPEGTAIEEPLPFAEFRTRNVSFLTNLAQTYGATAVAARSGETFVGYLRFYPKAVMAAEASSRGMCLRQTFPWGPPDDGGRRKYPPLPGIADKAIVIHCLMLAPRTSSGESRLRQGIGTRMVRSLIDWATARGWRFLEATAYEDLPIIYASTGQAGIRFWEKLGFRTIRVEPEPYFEENSEFVRKMREEARNLGIDPARLKNKSIMRLDLA